jgi:hypothetical protein
MNLVIITTKGKTIRYSFFSKRKFVVSVGGDVSSALTKDVLEYYRVNPHKLREELEED